MVRSMVLITAMFALTVALDANISVIAATGSRSRADSWDWEL